MVDLISRTVTGPDMQVNTNRDRHRSFPECTGWRCRRDHPGELRRLEMKVKLLATMIAVTFVMGAVGTADAGLFNFHKKNSCCRTHKSSCQTVSHCQTSCAPKCAPVSTCCSPRPSCCATRCGSGCAPAAGGTPASDDVESIPAPPTKDTEPPKPGTKADTEA